MGSSLETAIVFSLVLAFLCFLIAGPEKLILETLEDADNGMRELEYELHNRDIISSRNVDGVVVYSASPEAFCTVLSGISDNFTLMYKGIWEVASND